MLLEGLPAEARVRRVDPAEPVWGNTQELLAQLLEEVSVLASDRRRKKPVHVLRPKSLDKAGQPAGNAGGRRMGYRDLISAAMKRGQVRYG